MRMPPLHPDRPADDSDGRPFDGEVTGSIREGRAGSEDLRHVLKMISSSTDARRELVADIRDRVASGDYVTEEKLNLAIYRLLKDILD